MIKLRRYTSPENNAANYRYVTALMIEARIRGFPLMEACPERFSDGPGFDEVMDVLIDWLIDKYPDEFQRQAD